MFTLYSANIRHPFWKASSQVLDPSLSCCMALLLLKCRTLHLPLQNLLTCCTSPASDGHSELGMYRVKVKVWGSSQKFLGFYFFMKCHDQTEHYLVRHQESKQFCLSTSEMMYCLQLGLQGTHSYRGIDTNSWMRGFPHLYFKNTWCAKNFLHFAIRGYVNKSQQGCHFWFWRVALAKWLGMGLIWQLLLSPHHRQLLSDWIKKFAGIHSLSRKKVEWS